MKSYGMNHRLHAEEMPRAALAEKETCTKMIDDADEERVRELLVTWRNEGDGANLGRLIAQVSDLVASLRAAEREECAKVAETIQVVEGEPSPELVSEMQRDVVLTAEAAGNITARRIAAAIRARG